MEFLNNKTPIIIGLVMGIATYVYLSYTEKQRQEKNPKSKPKNISYIIPIIVAGITWFVSNSMLSKSSPLQLSQNKIIKATVAANVVNTPNKLNKMTSVEMDSLKETITMPNTEVFTDLGKFSRYTY